MANPTTNYGFVLPTSTDLVTDLPADFDVALQGVDTRLKALQPGTTLGDIAYSSATANTNTRLGVGSTGQVLTVASGVPSWATPAVAAAGFKYINSYSYSNVASLSMPSIFSATYDYYRIILDFNHSTTSDWLTLRYSTGGTDNTTTNYWSSDVRNDGTSVTGSSTTSPETAFIRAILTRQNANIVSIDVTNPFSNSLPTYFAGTFGCYSSSIPSVIAGAGSGWFNGNTSFDGMTLTPSVNFTGKAKVYGYSNS